MSSEGNKVLDGVGRDAEIVTNNKGGKQSKTPMALHLVDPKFLQEWADSYSQKAEDVEDNRYVAIREIAFFMEDDALHWLAHAMYHLEQDPIQRLVRIAKVLQYGADRYEANNWRLIPQESHINHALIHILADIMGDTQDDHLDHALCRLMMAHATEKSSNFSYTEYIPTTLTIKKSESKIFQPGGICEEAVDHPDFKLINKLQEEYDKFICKYKYDCHYKENE